MAILSFDDYIASFKQTIPFDKTGSLTTVAAQWSSTFALAGYPSAGNYNPGNTTTGLVPVAGATGFPVIAPFPVDAEGYLSRVEAFNTVVGQMALFDVLFWAGATVIPISGNTPITLNTQPDFSARLPKAANGVDPDWNSVELWAWPGTAWSNHAHSFTVSYQDGSDTPRTTPSQSSQNIALGRMQQVRLTEATYGLRQINGYTLNGIASASGSVVVAAMRRLWQANTPVANQMLTWGPDLTGMPQVFANSALLLAVQPTSTNSGTPKVTVEIAAF